MSVVKLDEYTAQRRVNERVMEDLRLRQTVRSLLLAVVTLRQLGYNEDGLAQMLTDIRNDPHPEASARLLNR